MKIKIISSLALLIFILIGCKNEKSAEDIETEKIKETEIFFKVTLTAIVKKDDSLSLFYTEDGSTDFKIDPIWNEIKGNEGVQKVVFNFSQEVFPTELRLDFGLKAEQKDIILKSVTLEYKGNKKEIIGNELGIYFRPDDTKCTFDPMTGVIKALVKDGVRQSPSLYPHQSVLKTEIQKLIK